LSEEEQREASRRGLYASPSNSSCKIGARISGATKDSNKTDADCIRRIQSLQSLTFDKNIFKDRAATAGKGLGFLALEFRV
jgi:hypothetical protein